MQRDEAEAWLLAASEQVRIVPVVGHRAVEPEARSYLGDGRVVVLRPPSARPLPGRFAIDAERRGQPVPRRLGRTPPFLDEPDFWRAWTRFEVGCKLLDRPVALALGDVPDEGRGKMVLRSFDLGGVAVTVGALVTNRADQQAGQPVTS